MAEAFSSIGLDSSRIRVIWNSVNAHHAPADPMKLRQDLGIPANQFLIGTVARLAKQKRIDRLLEVTALLPEVMCLIAGDGTRKEELEEKARSLDVEERVRFLGHRDDVGDVMAALDVFVMTSDTEGLSNAMLEAMSYALPIVSTDVSGAEDALVRDDHGAAAGLVTDFEPKSIASAIESLRKDPALRATMSRAARKRAITRFSQGQMLAAWEEVLARPTP